MKPHLIENTSTSYENKGIPPVMDLKSYIRVGAGNNEVYDFLNSLIDHHTKDVSRLEELIKVLLEIDIVGARLLRFKAEFKNDQDFVTNTLKHPPGGRFVMILKKYNQ